MNTLEVIKDLREALMALVLAKPCNIQGVCHCDTCTARHVLAYTSGYK